MKLFTTIFCMFLLVNQGIAQNNSFEGLFLNQQLDLKLTLKKGATNFTGQFELQGQ